MKGSAMTYEEEEQQEATGWTAWGLFLLMAVVAAGGAFAAHGIYSGRGGVFYPDDGARTGSMEFIRNPTPTPRAITPLSVPRVSDLDQFQGAHRERLYWGTYRSLAYLGIRARTPESLLAGLMWTGVNDNGHDEAIRHYCNTDDNLTKWSWLRHDGESYGRQVLVDHGLRVTTYFMKSSELATGYGGDWVVRVRVEEEKEPTVEKIELEKKTQSLFFYIADEAGSAINLWPDKNKIAKDAPLAGGVAKEIGGWQLHAKYKEGLTMNYAGVRQLYMPNLTDLVQSTLEEQKDSTGRYELPDASVKDPNVALIQLTGTLPFEMDMVFVSGVDKVAARVSSRVLNLAGSALSSKLINRELVFEERFQETFKLHTKVNGEQELETAKVALSNMLGGIGYFYGQARIAIPPEFQDPTSKIDYWDYWPASLYTAVPSRSVFPRGFLWDEGFHQLLISRWDKSMSQEIVANWMDLINVDGWIPREVILGEESLSRVPAAFINQISDNANPPSLLLVVRDFAKVFAEDKNANKASVEDTEFFERLFPRISVWFDWFNTSQIGKLPDSYYWRGRAVTPDKLNPQTLTSGMDDYPRASHPSDDERHVDLRCWMANASTSMAVIAKALGKPYELYETVSTHLNNLTRLNELHYDVDSGRYYDYGNHSEKVELQWVDVEDPTTGVTKKALQRVVLEPPKLGWVPQFGLNSLYPFMMHVIPNDSPILGHHLDMIADPDLMWTDFGLRSLGATSSLYMKYNSLEEAPYWRGPVWIGINYLVLAALHEYSEEVGPYKEQAAILYERFRTDVISNMVVRYQETGYIWENYDNAAHGKGQGAHPFTGWSSLVLLMMGEMYI